MRWNRKLVGGLIAALCVGVTGTAVAADVLPTPLTSGKSGLSPQDYLEISQLYGLYARDVDPGSPRNAAWLFTDDGEFNAGPGYDFRGKDQLTSFYEQVRQNQRNGTRHYNTTYAIIKTREGATSSGYMLWLGRPGPTDPWTVTGSGVYEDYLVKTNEGWRFKTRIFHNDTCRPWSPSGGGPPTRRPRRRRRASTRPDWLARSPARRRR